MQVVVACVLSLVTVAVAAPYSGMFLRRPRSHGYGTGYGYGVSPCAAGGLHAVPSAYHQGPAYQLNLPVQGYPQQHYGGYGVPHYRAEEEETGEEQEMMSFSDPEPTMSENAPMARYVSLGGYSGHANGLSPVMASSPGAVGVFPGANVGGCNVPLLLSCSPSIVPGRLVKSQHGSHYAPAYGAAPAAGAEAYRGADDHHPAHEQPEPATTVHETAAPDAARTQ